MGRLTHGVIRIATGRSVGLVTVGLVTVGLVTVGLVTVGWVAVLVPILSILVLTPPLKAAIAVLALLLVLTRVLALRRRLRR